MPNNFLCNTVLTFRPRPRTQIDDKLDWGICCALQKMNLHDSSAPRRLLAATRQPGTGTLGLKRRRAHAFALSSGWAAFSGFTVTVLRESSHNMIRSNPSADSAGKGTSRAVQTDPTEHLFAALGWGGSLAWSQDRLGGAYSQLRAFGTKQMLSLLACVIGGGVLCWF